VLLENTLLLVRVHVQVVLLVDIKHQLVNHHVLLVQLVITVLPLVCLYILHVLLENTLLLVLHPVLLALLDITNQVFQVALALLVLLVNMKVQLGLLVVMIVLLALIKIVLANHHALHALRVQIHLLVQTLLEIVNTLLQHQLLCQLHYQHHFRLQNQHLFQHQSQLISQL